jgi:hypothetical protein
MSGPVRVAPAETLASSEAISALRDEPNGSVPGSLLDRLRTHANEVQRTRTLDLPVPGFGGDLLLRFKPLDVGQLERFVESRSQGRTGQISEGIDAMCTCCIGVYARDAGKLIQLTDADGPVRIEHRLAVMLGMEIPIDSTLTAREVSIRLFGNNAFALGTFVDELATWMADPTAQVKPGES